jgi:hypothetical protein
MPNEHLEQRANYMERMAIELDEAHLTDNLPICEAQDAYIEALSAGVVEFEYSAIANIFRTIAGYLRKENQ